MKRAMSTRSNESSDCFFCVLMLMFASYTAFLSFSISFTCSWNCAFQKETHNCTIQNCTFK